MRLNTDCVRDILLTVEANCDFNNAMEYSQASANFELLNKYPPREVVYHIHQCEMSGLLHNVKYYDGGQNIWIQDLTPQGHEFIANIRDNSIWDGVKSVAKQVGSSSLSAIVQIAANTVSQIIKSQFKLN